MEDEEKQHQWLLKGLLYGSFAGIILSFMLHNPALIILCIAVGLVGGAVCDFYLKHRRKH